MKNVILSTAAIAISLLMQGCSASSPGVGGVGKIGNNRYLMIRQAGSGFDGLGPLKIEVLGEGDAFCRKLGRTIQMTQTLESRPPFILGNRPRTEITFMCNQ
tara:strand:+ start:75 stop:380 length:306 start_codon:yes stop_codon:yes gene_type:complete